MSRDQRQPPSVDLQERTLKVLSIPPMVTRSMLFELFNQCGPVKNVVLKTDAEFAFIEFEHKVSVGFALALMEGVQLFGCKIYLQPKIEDPAHFVYIKQLRDYEATYASNPRNYWRRFGRPGERQPRDLCRAMSR
ncbi:RNA-binding protein 7 [Brevipalpus obovatus]|uniref:RNA-binding protein 7 n=1 Tax=Brevipalpus obovatus TaxID=246614 RepID=UPI003D9F8335